MKSMSLLPAFAAGIALVAICGSGATAERAVVIPASHTDVPAAGNAMQTAVLAGGCFWGMEAVFERVRGVQSVTAGYAGGSASTANYDDVSSERTGHAEAIQIRFDPRQVSYGTLLRVYFAVAHDPTLVDRQGPDRGPSYRSAIFPQSREQATVAKTYIAELNATRRFSAPIATKLEQGSFYPA